MRKLTIPVLSRLAAITLTFPVGLILVRGVTPVFRSPDSSLHLIGALTPAVVEQAPWRSVPVEDKSSNWIFRRGKIGVEFDVTRAVALPTPDPNLVVAGCGTLVVTLDEERNLRLNTDDVGSLDEPSKLTTRLTEIFYEREINLAYRPGWEYREEIPSRERIEKTVVIIPSASLKYRDALRLLRVVEQTGAGPIVLHAGEATEIFRQAKRISL